MFIVCVCTLAYGCCWCLSHVVFSHTTKNSSQETSVNRKQYSKWLIQMEHFSSPQVFVVSVFYDWQFYVPVHNTYLLWIQFLLPYLNLYLARRILVIPWSVPKMCCWVLLPSLGCSNRVAGQTFGRMCRRICLKDERMSLLYILRQKCLNWLSTVDASF